MSYKHDVAVIYLDIRGQFYTRGWLVPRTGIDGYIIDQASD